MAKIWGKWSDSAPNLGAQTADGVIMTDDGWAIGADARIDNRREIAALLVRSGATHSPIDAAQHSDVHDHIPESGRASRARIDAALILAAYRLWGDAGLARLHGDFAAAIWDAKAREMVLIRDQMGGRALFYGVIGASAAFASDAETVLALLGGAARVDEAGMAGYLVGVTDADTLRARTCYADVRRVLDREVVRIRDAGGRLTTAARFYWDYNPLHELRYPNDDDYPAAFRALFDAAITARRRDWADGEIGAALSGGLDSSSVVCALRTLNQRDGRAPFQTFYMQPGRADADESAYVTAVLAGGGLIHRTADVPSIFAEGKAIYDTLDFPPSWLHVGVTLALYRECVRHGVRAFFDGIDGDTVIGYGRRWLTELFGRGDLGRFSGEARALAAQSGDDPAAVMIKYAFPHWNARARAGDWGAVIGGMGGLARAAGRSAWGIGAYWARNFFIPERITRAAQSIRNRDGVALALWAQSNPALRPDVARRANIEARLWALYGAPPLDARAEQMRILRSGRLADTLEITERISAAHGITTLHPLADRAIAEFCAALPGDQRIRDGRTRAILRRALADVLPESIATRGGKAEFSGAFLQTMRDHDVALLDGVFARADRIGSMIDVGRARALYGRWRGGGRISAAHSMALVRIARAILWMEAKGIS
jgi:asparagine synthase (glutamine-hydrolysing)